MNINKHTSHPSAFISSTFVDLKAERRAVAKVLKKSGLNINALDTKPASNESSKKEIIKGIRESDFVILIIGHRYGSILPEMTGSESRSITWWEYTIALNTQKPVLVYFKELADDNDINFDDKDAPDFEIKNKRLNQFKKLLSDNHNPKYFSNIDELGEVIESALIPVYRDGISKLLSRNDNLSRENEELKKQLENYTQKAAAPYGLDQAKNQPLGGLAGLLDVSASN